MQHSPLHNVALAALQCSTRRSTIQHTQLLQCSTHRCYNAALAADTMQLAPLLQYSSRRCYNAVLGTAIM